MRIHECSWRRTVLTVLLSVAPLLVGSAAPDDTEQWRCERLTGVARILNDGAVRQSGDSFDTGGVLRFNARTQSAEFFLDGETAEMRAAAPSEASLVSRGPDTVSIVEVTRGVQPSTQLYTLYTTEGFLFVSIQRRLLSGAPAVSVFSARCVKQR